MQLSKEPLLSRDRIADRVEALALEIEQGFGVDEPILMLCVLSGGVVFAVDLARSMRGPLQLDFIRARSYAGTESTGEVRLTVFPEAPLARRRVLVVEDILDTGRTSTAILDWVRGQNPDCVMLCTLLDKPSRRKMGIEADFVGFTIDDEFVVGYGLDYDGQFRNLPAIHVLEG